MPFCLPGSQPRCPQRNRMRRTGASPHPRRLVLFFPSPVPRILPAAVEDFSTFLDLPCYFCPHSSAGCASFSIPPGSIFGFHGVSYVLVVRQFLRFASPTSWHFLTQVEQYIRQDFCNEIPRQRFKTEGDSVARSNTPVLGAIGTEVD